MVRILSSSELHQKTYQELRVLFAKVSKELNRTQTGSYERRICLTNLENIQRAMAMRLIAPSPKPPAF